MNIYFGIAAFIFGILTGSFLNVCIYRIPKGESVVYPPSHCTTCGAVVKWNDLVPLVSYVFLGGRCRNCHDEISARYPLVEAAVGLLYVFLYIEFGFGIVFFKHAVFVSIMIVLGMIDFDTGSVYFNTILAGTVFSLIFLGLYIYMGVPFITFLSGGLLGGGIIAFIILLTGGKMGWGDMEMCFVAGLFLGLKLTFVMLVLSFISGAATGILLILLKKKSARDYMPFGPFISGAAIFTSLFGYNILRLCL